MAPKSLHFVLDEMLAWAPAPVLARHRYGCRVLERILEHFGEAAIKSLLEDLLYHAKEQGNQLGYKSNRSLSEVKY